MHGVHWNAPVEEIRTRKGRDGLIFRVGWGRKGRTLKTRSMIDKCQKLGGRELGIKSLSSVRKQGRGITQGAPAASLWKKEGDPGQERSWKGKVQPPHMPQAWLRPLLPIMEGENCLSFY